MGNKLYVGNLPYSLDEDTLKKVFSQAGNVYSVKIVTDPFDGSSKGFAFVEMSTDEEAQKAKSEFDGFDVHGRHLRVDIAQSQPS